MRGAPITKGRSKGPTPLRRWALIRGTQTQAHQSKARPPLLGSRLSHSGTLEVQSNGGPYRTRVDIAKSDTSLGIAVSPSRSINV